jgi:hypothetical protein
MSKDGEEESGQQSAVSDDLVHSADKKKVKDGELQFQKFRMNFQQI